MTSKTEYPLQHVVRARMRAMWQTVKFPKMLSMLNGGLRQWWPCEEFKHMVGSVR